jgi:hypothetical protein
MVKLSKKQAEAGRATPKPLASYELHSVPNQQTKLIINTALRTSDPIYLASFELRLAVLLSVT